MLGLKDLGPCRQYLLCLGDYLALHGLKKNYSTLTLGTILWTNSILLKDVLYFKFLLYPVLHTFTQEVK